MKNLLIGALCSLVFYLTACNGGKPAETVSDAAPKKDTTVVAPAEFADMKYGETVKNGLLALSRGDVPSWMATFADNAVYVWNTGDSIAGKAAISEYWTKRRAEVIDSLSFMNQIYLPIKVNKPQSVEAPGIWVLTWYQVTAKYKKTGKKMSQWMHTDSHFDANGKIDRLIQYSDRALINAAMTK